MSNDRFKFRVWNKDGKFMLHNDDVTLTAIQDPADDTVVMQCTGLKDKNGKLIYEGDVIKTETGAQIVVDWDPTKAGFIPWTWAYDDYCDPSTIEIVKNVYENPELIEDK